MHLSQGKQVISIKRVYNGCLDQISYCLLENNLSCTYKWGKSPRWWVHPKPEVALCMAAESIFEGWQHVASHAPVWRKGSSDTSPNTLGLQNCQWLGGKITILKNESIASQWVVWLKYSCIIDKFHHIIIDKDWSLCCQTLLFPLHGWVGSQSMRLNTLPYDLCHSL